MARMLLLIRTVARPPLTPFKSSKPARLWRPVPLETDGAFQISIPQDGSSEEQAGLGVKGSAILRADVPVCPEEHYAGVRPARAFNYLKPNARLQPQFIGSHDFE
jgi:hypothetical protein